MATVKVKFRPSTRRNAMGTVVYQVVHKRQLRQVKSECKVYPSEWDSENGTVICSTADAERKAQLTSVTRKMRADVEKFHDIITQYEQEGRQYDASDVIQTYRNWKARYYEDGFMDYCKMLTDRFLSLGRRSAAEKLSTAMNSFLRFLGTEDISMREISTLLMEQYDSYLKEKAKSPNTRSFYLRTLRAAYNTAVEEGATEQRTPFRKVYTGIAKTVKRALTFQEMQSVKRMELSGRPLHQEARDIFLLSFYMRGISLIDLAHLRKKDLRYGVVSYRRHKTGQLITMKWETCMNDIKNRLWTLAGTDEKASPFLLPIIRITRQEEAENADNLHRLYVNAFHLINNKLHTIGQELSLPLLTTYVARHSWASIAKNRNIPISVISEGLGHDSERTTQIYLASLDTRIIDEANRKVWRGL